MKDHTEEQIDRFLSERRKSDGGYAKITNADMLLLAEIINSLIKEKCEPDPDGDYPIEFFLANLRKERFACSPQIIKVPRIGDETLDDVRSMAFAVHSLAGQIASLAFEIKEESRK